MLSRIGLFSACARASASGPHGYQSTGLLACCSRYGLVSLARRLGIVRSRGGASVCRQLRDVPRIFRACQAIQYRLAHAPPRNAPLAAPDHPWRRRIPWWAVAVTARGAHHGGVRDRSDSRCREPRSRSARAARRLARIPPIAPLSSDSRHADAAHVRAAHRHDPAAIIVVFAAVRLRMRRSLMTTCAARSSAGVLLGTILLTYAPPRSAPRPMAQLVASDGW